MYSGESAREKDERRARRVHAGGMRGARGGGRREGQTFVVDRVRRMREEGEDKCLREGMCVVERVHARRMRGGGEDKFL